MNKQLKALNDFVYKDKNGVKKMIKNYNEIIYNINFNHGININKNNLYLKNGWLFVDLKDDTIEVFKYPVNEYFEPYTHLWNIKKKPFKDFINNEINFSGEYPVEKNEIKIKLIA